ncbi:MAG: hypothetical protein U0736_24865 [Gemmataceae bacterium]
MKRSQLVRGEPRPYEPVIATEGFGAGEPPAGRLAGLWRRWVRFWFTADDPVRLHVLRVMAGLLFLAWLLPIAGSLDSLYSLDGWFDLQAYRESARLPEGAPKPMTWSVLYLAGSGWKLHVFYWASIATLLAFTLGLATRVTAVLTWIIVGSFTASPLLDADVDPLLVLLAFYLMVGYLLIGQINGDLNGRERLLGAAPRWWQRWLGRGDYAPASVAVNLTVRLLQIHMALVIVSNGFHKLQFGDWWGGIAFWFPLYSSPDVTLADVRRHAAYADAYVVFLNVLTYGAVLWQIGFPLFAWKPAWRPLLVGGAAIGWLVNTWVYQMPLFGGAIFIGCMSFVSDWRVVGAWVAAVARRLRAAWKPKVADSIPVASGQN